MAVNILKPGWQTSEFWLAAFTLLTGFVQTLDGKLDPELFTALASVIAAGYAFARYKTKTAAIK